MSETVRQVVIVVPLAPPAALAPNRLGHEHWRNRQQAAKELRDIALGAACFHPDWYPDADRRPVFHGTVTIHEHIVWPKGKRLKDPDSLLTYCKPALDGIVDAGIIAGDSAKHIAHISASQARGDDATGRIEIRISEVVE
jgi:hypothetical protein